MSRVLKIVLGSILLGQGVMAAQPAAPPPAVTPAPGAPASDADVPVRQRPTLSPQDMLSQANDYRTRMAGILKQVQALAEQARKTKDVIKLNCLTDKIAQLKANIAVADKVLADLQDAIDRRDEGASAHEYSRITIVNQKAQVLGAEGQACVGEDLAFVGATRLDIEIDGVVPGDYTNPSPPTVVVDRPPSASPFGG